MDLPPLSFHASLEEQWDEEEELEEIETVLKVVPPAYHKYLDVFSKVKAEKLPPHHACDHHIELEGLLPPKGFIRLSSSSTGAPVLFVKKKDGGLCLCVEYRKLNAVSRKNGYPVLPINQLLTVFNNANIFSKIDLRGAYSLLRIKEGDEHLTAFRTKYGSYEYLFMPFGLTNGPASFQNLVNDIFADLLDILVVVYLDDIMVFSFFWEEHVKHVASVLQRLRDNNLFAKASKISALTSLLIKDSPFIFNEEALSQLSILKEAFTTVPILSHFNPSLQTIVETDGSDYALGAVLSQVNDSGKHPISFDSGKLIPADLNYEMHDKELFGIAWALKHWRSFLLSLSDSFEVLTDHLSLQYLLSSKFLTCRQACWSEFLSEFHFSITYHPGRLATSLDALSRQDKVYPERGKAVWQDKDYEEILKQLARDESVSDYTLEPQAKLLLFEDRVVILRNHELQLDILQKHHDSPLAGRPGPEKTLKLIKRDFSWAGMNQIINDYVSPCQQCSRNKRIHHKKFLLLKPLQIPSGPLNSLSKDFITQLPLSRNFDSILVVVYGFSKMAIFIPAYSTITALDLAQLFISHVFYKHGLSISIVSDRGSLFVSSFWTQLCQQLKISRDLSTAFYPETDGQTERVNQILEQYLWMYVSYHQDDWHTWLPLAEFAYNNAENSSTKQSPFFTIYGRNPSFDSIHISQDSPAGKLSTKLQSVQQVFKEKFKSEIRRFKKYADKNRSVPPDLQPGEKVWLAYKNIKTTRPTKKLSERWLGPFEVIKKIGSHAYHLKFLQQWKSVHPVSHVSLLEPVKQSSIPNNH
ncbi:hypothetical protein O181_019139 [Austropuccinia psidii MF-1]|uniref:Integrase catalytic domain-containing protein n=1 Tax=Austropuccinia psidii MF-1 TaxID=1389203 RepID=A0A9Q3GUF6_9BASI|nr:hypothetical protein [Austropuccinia psidii MF-1]